MQRLATTLALTIWLGFSATSAALLLIRAFAPADGEAGLAAFSRELAALGTVPALGPFEALCFAAFLLGVALVLGCAAAAFQRGRRAIDRSAEALASAGLAALFVFQTVASLSGSPVAPLFGAGPGFLFGLVAAFAALLFDHTMATYAEEEDDAFEAALRALRGLDEPAKRPHGREAGRGAGRRRNDR